MENLSNIFKNLGDHNKLPNNILETKIELIYIGIYLHVSYKLLLILGLIPISNIKTEEWLMFPGRGTLTKNEIFETELPHFPDQDSTTKLFAKVLHYYLPERLISLAACNINIID